MPCGAARSRGDRFSTVITENLGCDPHENPPAGAGVLAYPSTASWLPSRQRAVELTILPGTHVTVAMLLAMAEEGVPAGKEQPFRPGEP